ncbi:hypothetical protein PUN28_000508 [Cardiocondyla obscurior]|uniref:Uncharacterized protein n=1 Tax=Cardiocondyla obscurior TaxID=286306 RepID=A0AAW2GZV5_9HYME
MTKPVTQNNYKRNNNPKSWWDEECQTAINNRKKDLKKFKKTRNIHDYIEYKKYQICLEQNENT